MRGRMMWVASVAAVAVVALIVGGRPMAAEKPKAPAPPADANALTKWLRAGHYKAWPAETKVHESDGPHFGKVRTFMTPELVASMKAGNDEHPKGSVAVKELYKKGDKVLGWAVMIKVDAKGADGAGWYWYEQLEPRTKKGKPQRYAAGKGVEVCTDCHGAGDDQVLTPVPLR